MCFSFKISHENDSFDEGFSCFILLFVGVFLQSADFYFCQGLLLRNISEEESLYSIPSLLCVILHILLW